MKIVVKSILKILSETYTNIKHLKLRAEPSVKAAKHTVGIE